MSPLSIQDRLDDLAREVQRLLVATVEDERAMGDFEGIDDEQAALSAARAFETRLRRDQALIRYFEESEAARAGQCPVHGSTILVSCPDCARRCAERRAA